MIGRWEPASPRFPGAAAAASGGDDMQDGDRVQALTGPSRRQGCLGAFSVKDQESIRVVVATAEEEDSPVALCVNADLVAPPAIKVLSGVATSVAARASVPVAVILSHARNLDLVSIALDCGFSTVMFDGSFLPLTSNVNLTARAVDLAARARIPLEGAIGAFSDFGKDSAGQCLICALAAKFVLQTGIGSLAVSLPLDARRGFRLDMELLRRLRQSVPGGLSLHDASLLAPRDILGAMAAGISRLSFGACLFDAAANSLAPPGRFRLAATVRQTLRLFRHARVGRRPCPADTP
ncbi:MAG: class II fructose-bisphosphate aldolase [Desulfobaccales bacterium]